MQALQNPLQKMGEKSKETPQKDGKLNRQISYEDVPFFWVDWKLQSLLHVFCCYQSVKGDQLAMIWLLQSKFMAQIRVEKIKVSKYQGIAVERLNLQHPLSKSFQDIVLL